MIDNAAILFSTVMVVIVIYRAVRLDAVQPWFKPFVERKADDRPKQPWQR